MKLYKFILSFIVLALLICIVPSDLLHKPKNGSSYVYDSEIMKTDELYIELKDLKKASNLFNNELNQKRFKFIETAYKQIGNIGGEKYWRWYGFKRQVSWCAIFVSWCGEQNGLIKDDIIPKFASVTYGERWFMAKNQWLWKDEQPKEGMIIFFDFTNKALDNIQDGIPDHVGIVLKVDDEYVYCIEGNHKNKCEQTMYDIDSIYIFGYGDPKY